MLVIFNSIRVSIASFVLQLFILSLGLFQRGIRRLKPRDLYKQKGRYYKILQAQQAVFEDSF